MESFDRLQSLDKSSTNWKIKVRVTRMWPSVTAENASLKGFNLILLDDDNNHVHAFAFHNIWNAITTPIIEGGVYIIDQFAVRDVAGSLKPVQSELCIRFTTSTTVKPADDDGMIPAHKFEFLDLGDLLAEAQKCLPKQQPEFAIDLIGVVEEFEELTKLPTKFGERDIVKFRICDSSNGHKVSVWGDLAISMNEMMRNELEKPIIAILTSTKVGTFMDWVQIGTLPSSHVYLNLDDDTVRDMRQRLHEEGYLLKRDKFLQSKKSELVPQFFQKLSLKDLNENLTYDHLKKKIFCTFRIIKVDEEASWFFYSCSKCLNEVERVDTRFRCNVCPRIIPVSPKRFCVMLLAEDETFACNVVLMDRAARRILGTSAAKVYSDFEKDPTKTFPKVLKELVGKEVCVELKLNKSNVTEDNNLFHAEDIYDASMATPSTSESAPFSESSTVNLTADYVEGEEIEQTPGSVSSVTKKIKKEVI